MKKVNLVSVVVPVYNVEKYLKKCIESILRQSYDNFELIIVDDGSTDSSGKICDEIKSIDNRITVYHKENGGLSDARNYGIDRANGDYITFIDSDDYIHEDFLKTLVELVVKYNTDISIVGSVALEEGKSVNEINTNKIIEKCMNTEEALECMLLRRGFGISAWSKLYKTDLFNDIRYPKGLLYEDTYTTPYVIDKCDKIAYNSQKMYYWVQRQDSITHRKLADKDFKLFDSFDELVKFINKNYPNISEAAECRYIDDSFITIMRRLVYSDDYLEKAEYVRSKCNNYWKSASKNKYVRKRRRLEAATASRSLSLYRMLTKTYDYLKKFK